MTKVLLLSLVFLIFLYTIQLIFNSPRGLPLNSPNTLTLPDSTPWPNLTLNTIFSTNHSWTQKLNPGQTVTLIATGDIILARVTNLIAVQKNDFSWAFKKIAETLKGADITFINLETPLMQNCKPTNEGMTFCGDVRHLQGLLSAGVDVVSLANNHAGNYGPTPVEDTKKLLEQNHIAVTGISGPNIKEVKGVKFAFLGYNDIGKFAGVSQADETKICSEIKDVKPKVDVVIVQYHWGVEYRSQPDESQKSLGHLTIDCGADLVIGNHPHWIQPVEFYHDKLITYALGNTIFDQEWSQKTKEGVIGRYLFFNKKLVDVEYLPLLIQNYGQPSFLGGVAKQKILDEMKNQSEILATASTAKN